MQPTRSSSAVLYGARARNDTAVIDGCFADDVVWNAPGTRTGRVPRRKLELFAAIGTLDELTGGTLRGGIHCVLANDHQRRGPPEDPGRAGGSDPARGP
jgi:ketosteroid isomerase-like protein